MPDVLPELALYLRLVAADVRSQMQYRVSFLLLTLGSFGSLFLEFFAILIFFQRFPHLAGWSVGEVAFLYALASLSFGLAELVCGGFDHFAQMIRLGEFDRVLSRPASPFTLIFCQEFQLRRLGRIAHGGAVLVLAQWLPTAGGAPLVEWTLPRLFYLPVAVVSGAGLFAAVFILGATLCFWTVQSSEVTNIFTHGGTEMVSYPMSIYEGWLRHLFVFVVPLAFATYFPALYLLGKPDALGLPGFFPFLPLPVAVGFLAVARLVWRFGVQHYQSTGS